MSHFVLDSDILSLLEQGDSVVAAHTIAAPVGSVATTVISVEEMLSGWYTLLRRAKRREQTVLAYERLATSVEFLATFPIRRFVAGAADRFEELKKMRLGVRGNDLRIAAIALEHGATVVTRNVRDFQLIPRLAIEGWSKPYSCSEQSNHERSRRCRPRRRPWHADEVGLAEGAGAGARQADD